MGNSEIRPITVSKPRHWLIWNCEHMITSGRYAPKSIFVKNPCSGGIWREWWNITSQIIFFYKSTFFSRKRLQVTPVDSCSRAVAQKTWNYSRKCLLGVRTLKLISAFYIIAKTVEILAKTGQFFSTERLTMELFKSKVPLIVIVAP